MFILVRIESDHLSVLLVSTNKNIIWMSTLSTLQYLRIWVGHITITIIYDPPNPPSYIFSEPEIRHYCQIPLRPLSWPSRYDRLGAEAAHACSVFEMLLPLGKSESHCCYCLSSTLTRLQVWLRVLILLFYSTDWAWWMERNQKGTLIQFELGLQFF